ncbi:MAG: hypothetical protein OIF50_15295 [Flavobacteriaceae bacterium]|nr:hypothetical protein [Flavobacteriaceae bacterium]
MQKLQMDSPVLQSDDTAAIAQERSAGGCAQMTLKAVLLMRRYR